MRIYWHWFTPSIQIWGFLIPNNFVLVLMALVMKTWWFWANTFRIKAVKDLIWGHLAISSQPELILFCFSDNRQDVWPSDRKRLCFRSMRCGKFPDRSDPGISRTRKCCNFKSSIIARATASPQCVSLVWWRTSSHVLSLLDIGWVVRKTGL